MGITLHVESIITPLARRTPGPRERFIIQEHRVNRICEIFQWSQPPWDEPSETQGIDTSANYTRWWSVLRLAHICDVLFDRIDTRAADVLTGVALEIGIPTISLPQEPIRQFVHLLWHHENSAYWLPYEFETPQFLTTPLLGDHEQYRFSIGSSYHLAREMDELCDVCDAIVATVGAERVVGVHSHTWEGIQDLCHVVRQGAQESLSLQVPFMVLW
jgi:hypothetical protein